MLKKSFAVVALLLIVGLVGAALVTATDPDAPAVVEIPDPIERDLADIVERDTVVALTTYNSTSYFVYRGSPMGYEYELLSDFAEEAELTLVMQVVPRDSILYYLNTGRGDIAAARLEPAVEDTARFAFSEGLYTTDAVLVQQEEPLDEDVELPQIAALPDEIAAELRADSIALAERESELTPLQIRARRVERLTDLDGRRVFLPEDHSYVQRLVEVEDQITGDIRVVEVDTSSATLIRQVAAGNIEFTAAQENVAELEEAYYGNLTLLPRIGESHEVAWAVRQNAPGLREAVDRWILENRDSGRWATLYRKYYIDRRGYRERVESEYLTGETGTLSDYDVLLKRYAPTIGWDWRLLAAQTFQESRFKPNARSWAGAMGLLQLMPATAREVGVANPYDPDENVAGAVRYLEWLRETYWEERIPDEKERLKFILASYNAGSGHVMDAQRLTEKYGGDPLVWADVAYWLLQKSNAEYYNDPVVKYGYARGLEPVEYVSRILERYDHYSQFTDGAEGADAVPSAEANAEA